MAPTKSKTATAGKGKKVESGKTQRLTVFLTPEDKRHLRYLCADDDVTIGEWIARAIANAWGNRTD